MGAAMLNVRLGTKVNLVSYRGTGPAMNDLIAGRSTTWSKCRSRRWPNQAKTVRPLAVFRSADFHFA
jgi:tripartite-type tricarboxylate transporter receptor subunit TctC